MNLESNVTTLFGVGEKNARGLKKLGIFSIKDLIFYRPRKWIDRRKISKLSEVIDGKTFQLLVSINSISLVGPFRKQFVRVLVSDSNKAVAEIFWFKQPYLIKVLKEGDQIFVSGKVFLKGRRIIIQHPIWEKIDKKNEIGSIASVYSENTVISSKLLRSLIAQALLKIQWKWSPLLLSLHFPKSSEQLKKTIGRLSLLEMVSFYVSLFLKQRLVTNAKSYSLVISNSQKDKLINSAPFVLTQSQISAVNEIVVDMSKKIPMARLLNGEVGSGKTVVAALSMSAAMSQGQTCLLAPTSVLAIQHKKTFDQMGIQNVLITSQSKNKRQIYKDILIGKTRCIIGTHALLSEKINFKKLMLVVIDEQQRFGVMQRSSLLTNKLYTPHLLSLTATPIPRSLALTYFLGMDVSRLTDMPYKRSIITKISDQKLVLNFAKKMPRGKQAYLVYPTIYGEGGALEAFDFWKDQFHSVALLHGQMDSKEIEKVMDGFYKGSIQFLVCTSLIEVGVDAPGAHAIAIFGAERFGLSQLHQLRGRVGRRGESGACFVIPNIKSDKTVKRLKKFENINDGLKLAEYDLENRGPGNLIGVVQHGFPEFKFANIFDLELSLKAKKYAQQIIEKNKNITVKKFFPID